MIVGLLGLGAGWDHGLGWGLLCGVSAEVAVLLPSTVVMVAAALSWNRSRRRFAPPLNGAWGRSRWESCAMWAYRAAADHSVVAYLVSVVVCALMLMPHPSISWQLPGCSARLGSSPADGHPQLGGTDRNLILQPRLFGDPFRRWLFRPRATASAMRSCSGRNCNATMRAWRAPWHPACAMPRRRPQISTSPRALIRAPGFTSPRTNTAPSTSRCSPARMVPRCTCNSRPASLCSSGWSGLGASAWLRSPRADEATSVLGSSLLTASR